MVIVNEPINYIETWEFYAKMSLFYHPIFLLFVFFSLFLLSLNKTSALAHHLAHMQSARMCHLFGIALMVIVNTHNFIWLLELHCYRIRNFSYLISNCQQRWRVLCTVCFVVSVFIYIYRYILEMKMENLNSLIRKWMDFDRLTIPYDAFDSIIKLDSVY